MAAGRVAIWAGLVDHARDRRSYQQVVEIGGERVVRVAVQRV